MKKVQESRLNLVKWLLLSKEKPHFRRSAVWQAAPIKISLIFSVLSDGCIVFGKQTSAPQFNASLHILYSIGLSEK